MPENYDPEEDLEFIDESGKYTHYENHNGQRIKLINYHAKNNLKEGDYLYGPDIRGVYLKGGLVIDFVDDESLGMQDEWKNVLLRESLAKSSLIKIRKVQSSTYFTKGKLNDLGFFLKKNPEIDIVFVNTVLTPL